MATNTMDITEMASCAFAEATRMASQFNADKMVTSREFIMALNLLFSNDVAQEIAIEAARNKFFGPLKEYREEDLRAAMETVLNGKKPTATKSIYQKYDEALAEIEKLKAENVKVKRELHNFLMSIF